MRGASDVPWLAPDSLRVAWLVSPIGERELVCIALASVRFQLMRAVGGNRRGFSRTCVGDLPTPNQATASAAAGSRARIMNRTRDANSRKEPSR